MFLNQSKMSKKVHVPHKLTQSPKKEKKQKRFFVIPEKMFKKEEVIDIDKNIVIDVDEVNNTASPTVEDVVVEEGSVMTNWKRIVIGVSLILLMLLPVVGGTLAAYFLRKDLYEPVDPYNVWPDTDYTGPSRVEYEDVADKGYSEEPNHHILIKNGTEKYFVVTDGTSATMYMSVYMIENMYGNDKMYGFHVVSSTNADDLSPLADITSATDPHDIIRYTDKLHLVNGSFALFQDPPGECLAEKLLNHIHHYGFTGDQAAVMNKISSEIKMFASSPAGFSTLYMPTSYKTGSYVIPDSHYNDIRCDLLNRLQELRTAKRREEEEKAAKSKSKQKKRAIIQKPKFKKIQIKNLKEMEMSA